MSKPRTRGGKIREIFQNPAPEEFSPQAVELLPDTYQFDLARILLRDKAFCLDFSRYFDSFAHLDHVHLQWSTHLLGLWWSKHQARPTLQNVRDGVVMRVRKGDFPEEFGFGLLRFFEEVVFSPLENDESYIKEQSRRWLQRRVLLGAHEEVRNALIAGEDEKAKQVMSAASTVNFEEGREVASYVEGTEEAIKERKNRRVERIRLGLGLDDAMAGGVDRKTLTLIGGPSDVGKTTLACYVGGQIIDQGYSVAHVSLETPFSDVRDLYDSYHSQVERNSLIHNPDAIRSAVAKLPSNPLEIGRWKPHEFTPMGIRGWLLEMRAKDFYPDVLIVDSPDELIPHANYQDGLYLANNIIYLQLIGIAADFNLAVVITTQTKGETYNKEVIYLHQVADSLNKARRAHNVIFLCQTDKMRSASPAYLVALLAKQKNGKVNMISPLRTDYGRTRFYPCTLSEMRSNLGHGFTVAESKEQATA